MSIDVQLNPEALEPYAGRGLRCCFCREETRFIYLEYDVPCCKGCATLAYPKDVPERRTWVRREEIAMGIGSPMLCGKIKGTD